MRKIIYWIIGLFLFCGWADLVWSQTYTVGDTVGNFNLEICENGEGTWDYHVDGLHNVTWINLFTSW
jgi:hypothetical protein